MERNQMQPTENHSGYYRLTGSILLFFGLLTLAACGPVETNVQVTVARPPAQVWTAFNDDDKLKQWLTGLESIELIEGKDGEVGSKYRMKFIEDDAEFILEETLTEFDPPKALGFDVYHETMSTKMRYTFTQVENGTRIDGRNITEGIGPVWSIMVPMMKSMMIERQQSELELFKEIVEGE